MSNNKAVDKKGVPASNGLENGNGSRSAAGLVVAGLVTVIGSWIGMAAYMDYRLQGVEERIANDAMKQVVSAVDTTRSTMDAQFAQLTQGINKNIDNSSSVLAKSLLELIKKQEDNQAQSMQALEKTGTTITEALGDLKNSSLTEITSLLTNQQESITNGITQLTNKVDAGIQDIASSVDTMGRSTRSSNEAVLASMQNLDNNLAEVNNGLLAHMDSNVKTLEDLVNRSNDQDIKQLTELTNTIASVASGANDGSQKLSTELSALAERVSSMRSEIATTQNSVRELNSSIPEWQKNSQHQLMKIEESAQNLNQKLQIQFSDLQTKVCDMDQRIDTTSESLLRALYMTSEGMEGTKIEIKSQMENSNQETSEAIQNLVQSLHGVSQQLESLQKNVATPTTGSQSSAIPLENATELKKLSAMLLVISQKTNTLRTQIDSQVEEVKARTETLLSDDNAKDRKTALSEMLYTYTSLAEMAGGSLDTLLEELQQINTLMKPFNSQLSQDQGVETTELQSDAGSTTTDSAEIGLNPEERTPESQKVSMQ